MIYGCIGEHLAHSFSKDIHSLIGDYNYEIYEIAPNELEALLKTKDFKAINVTIPYKQAVIPFLDEISAEAKAIGAVNTIINSGGKLTGYNTDVQGLNALINRTGVDFSNKKVLILGTGGTSKTAEYISRKLGAKEVIRLSRQNKEYSVTYCEAYNHHSNAEIIINATPCGMYPDIFESPIDIERFPNLEGVIDAVYNPLQTKLVQRALSRGIKASNGLYMLVAQALAAAELFGQNSFTKVQCDRIYDSILLQRQNIVLIGMPCCGKTTVGRAIAQKFNRKFIDIDEVIVDNYGNIRNIIKKNGEEYFRSIESETIRNFAANSGKVIATGGGAVLKAENIDALRMNGKIVFLDRNIKKLSPSYDRPLADNENKINELYIKRHGLYLSCADYVINADGSVDDTVEAMEEMIQL